MISGLIVASATPALAQPDDVELFMPEGDRDDKNQLSDRFDGVDNLAHLTAVAGEDTVEVLFFFCEPDTPDETFDEDQCDLVGEDSEGVDPGSGEDPDGDDQDELAFEAFVDIGADTEFQDEEVDVVALACDSDVTYDTDFENNDIPDDCTEDREEDVFVDDEDDDTEDVPAGEIVGICWPNPDQEGGFGEPADAKECDSAEEFSDAEHGARFPGGEVNDFFLLFRTSEDVTDVAGNGNPQDTVGACIDIDADFDTEPNACDDFSDAITDTGEGDDYNEFIAYFDDPNGGVGEEDGDIAIYGESEDDPSECVNPAGGAGFSAGDPNVSDDADDAGDLVCVFDEHYFLGIESGTNPTSIGATFDPTRDRQPERLEGSNGEDRAQPSENERTTAQGEICDNPDTEETNEIGDVEGILACLEDEFGRVSSEAAVMFLSEGVGGFIEETCEGHTADTDNDGQADVCTEDTADFDKETNPGGQGDVTEEGESDITGTASVDITEPEEAGTQTITVCIDDDGGDASDDDENAETTCPTGGPTATLTKSWGGGDASQVDLVFDDGTAGCAGGREFRQNQIGDTDTLRVCTFDEFGNPAGTDEFNEDLEWDIENPNVAHFTDQPGNPPGETDNTSGQATATIRANAAGTTDITVCVGSGATADCDQVTKTVSGEGPPPPAGRPECSDGVDNDGDGTVDTADTDCTGPNDTSENPGGAPLPLCNNNVDDDGDGRTDEQDPGCSGPNDNSESPDPKPPARSNTNTTIRYDESVGAFKGSVGSNRKACSRFRKVVLKKAVPGPNKTVGTDRSNRAGNWKVRKPRANGNFYAVAKRKRFTNRFGRVIICLRDKSPTINV